MGKPTDSPPASIFADRTARGGLDVSPEIAKASATFCELLGKRVPDISPGAMVTMGKITAMPLSSVLGDRSAFGIMLAAKMASPAGNILFHLDGGAVRGSTACWVETGGRGSLEVCHRSIRDCAGCCSIRRSEPLRKHSTKRGTILGSKSSSCVIGSGHDFGTAPDPECGHYRGAGRIGDIGGHPARAHSRSSMRQSPRQDPKGKGGGHRILRSIAIGCR